MTAELPALERASWFEVDESDRRLLLWPIGSTEQHGPHLPLGTDTAVASALAAEAHRRFPTVGLAPALPIGASGEHQDFPGTLSIGTEALTSVIVEFVRQASRGWDCVLVINGHGGNANALRAAVRQLAVEGRSVEVYNATLSGPLVDAHAGHHETSLMLHLHPDLVRVDLAEPGATRPIGELMPALVRTGVRAVSANGVIGDPTGADAVSGRLAFESMMNALTARIVKLLDG